MCPAVRNPSGLGEAASDHGRSKVPQNRARLTWIRTRMRRPGARAAPCAMYMVTCDSGPRVRGGVARARAPRCVEQKVESGTRRPTAAGLPAQSDFESPDTLPGIASSIRCFRNAKILHHEALLLDSINHTSDCPIATTCVTTAIAIAALPTTLTTSASTPAAALHNALALAATSACTALVAPALAATTRCAR